MRQPGGFGQMCWDTYTVGVLGFRIAPTQSPATITKALDQAAIKLLDAYPFLAGKVINEGRSSTSSGTYKIVPYPPHSNGKSPVQSQDLSHKFPSYDELIKADAPFSMLDGDVLCPVRGIGHVYDQTVDSPVFILQANFIRGGLLLCFASQHNALDMNGQGFLMRQLATLMRGEELDPKIVAVGNQDPDIFVPLLKEGEVQLKHEEMAAPSSLKPINGAEPPAPAAAQGPVARWVYWRFPHDKLAKLKKMASSNGTREASTNDTVTAFWTQRATAVRVAAGRLSRDESLQCFRAADGRQRLSPPVPKGFLGHLVALSYTKWPTASDVLDSPLSKVVNDLRASLNQVDDHYVRSLATQLNSREDKTTIFYGASKNLGKDVFISSWAQMDLARTCDFGRVFGTEDGRPDFVKRAKMDPVPDLAYIMPKSREGDMDFGLCLFEEDIKAIQEDKMWTEYTKLIG